MVPLGLTESKNLAVFPFAGEVSAKAICWNRSRQQNVELFCLYKKKRRKPMADDANNTAAENKSKSLIAKVSDFLNNPDIQKNIQNLTALASDEGLTQAEKEAKVKEFNENDQERIKKEQELLQQLKANEGKIAHNDELLEASREAVKKLEAHIANIDAKIAKLDADFGGLTKEGRDLDDEAAALKKKLEGR
jgi:chromosome segregation ATPase